MNVHPVLTHEIRYHPPNRIMGTSQSDTSQIEKTVKTRIP
jgi:hypothetical protein